MTHSDLQRFKPSYGTRQMKIVTEQQVVEAVQRHVKDLRPGGAQLEVLTQGVRQDQDWRCVMVRPDKQPAKRYEYYEALADAEVQLLEEGLTVLLAPVLPEEELTAT